MSPNSLLFLLVLEAVVLFTTPSFADFNGNPKHEHKEPFHRPRKPPVGHKPPFHQPHLVEASHLQEVKPKPSNDEPLKEHKPTKPGGEPPKGKGEKPPPEHKPSNPGGKPPKGKGGKKPPPENKPSNPGGEKPQPLNPGDEPPKGNAENPDQTQHKALNPGGEPSKGKGEKPPAEHKPHNPGGEPLPQHKPNSPGGAPPKEIGDKHKPLSGRHLLGFVTTIHKSPSVSDIKPPKLQKPPHRDHHHVDQINGAGELPRKMKPAVVRHKKPLKPPSNN